MAAAVATRLREGPIVSKKERTLLMAFHALGKEDFHEAHDLFVAGLSQEGSATLPDADVRRHADLLRRKLFPDSTGSTPEDLARAEEHYARGLVYYGAKDYPKARTEFLEALRINPLHARARNSLGLLEDEMKYKP